MVPAQDCGKQTRSLSSSAALGLAAVGTSGSFPSTESFLICGRGDAPGAGGRGRTARRPPRFSFSPELPRAGRLPFRASPGASSSLSDVPDESESESESEEDEDVSGTRSSSWHIRLKRSSFSRWGDGEGTAGPSAEAKGGFGFCRERWRLF